MYSSHKKLLLMLIVSLFILSTVPAEEIIDVKERANPGYIVQFKDKSSLEKYNELSDANQRNINKYNSMFFLNPVKWYYGLFIIKSQAKIQREVSEYDKILSAKINRYLEDMKSSQAIDNSKIGTRFTKSISGVTLYIDSKKAENIKDLDYVRSVTPNLILKAAMKDSVNLMGINQLWLMKDSHNLNLDGSGITIAVIDTGFDLSHPVFSGIDVIKSQCYCNHGEPCCPDGGTEMSGDESLVDISGHGTHVLSILASKDQLYKGVAPEASYILIKASGSDNTFSLEDMIRSLQAAIDPNGDGNFADRADVLSLSVVIMPKTVYEAVKAEYQGQFTDEELREATIELFRPLNDLLSYASSIGMTVVAAAGNEPEGGNITAFAMIEEPLIVGATTKDNTIAPYTSEGPAFNGIEAPDVVATGGCTFDCIDYGVYGNLDNTQRYNYLRVNAQKGIISAKSGFADCVVKVLDVCFDTGEVFGINQELYTFEGDKYVSLQGTSFSTPFVAGIAALIKQKHPDWSSGQIHTAIKNSAVDIGMSRIKQGRGRVDGVAAINFDFTCTGKDMMTDPDNCGVCGNVCPGNYECVTGVCESCGDNVCNGEENHNNCPSDCPSCVPQCDNKKCGDDGCGGTCGTCSTGQTCYQRQCAFIIKGINVTCTGGTCEDFVLGSLPADASGLIYNTSTKVYNKSNGNIIGEIPDGKFNLTRAP